MNHSSNTWVNNEHCSSVQKAFLISDFYICFAVPNFCGHPLSDSPPRRRWAPDSAFVYRQHPWKYPPSRQVVAHVKRHTVWRDSNYTVRAHSVWSLMGLLVFSVLGNFVGSFPFSGLDLKWVFTILTFCESEQSAKGRPHMNDFHCRLLK